jgi:hypothetical protein
LPGEIDKLIRSQPAATAATLFTIGLDGHRTVCLRWLGPFADQAELYEQVEERALRQANALGGMHNFMLELVDAKGEQLGTEFFRVGAEGFGERSMLAEPANEGGVLAQSMRLTEALARLQVMGSEKNMNAAHKLIDALGRRAEHSETKYLDGIQTIARALAADRASEVEAIKATGNAQAKGVIANKVAALIPQVLASFLSKNAGPQGPAHASALRMKDFTSTLTGEQFESILGVLRPEQQGALAALLSGVHAENVAETAQPTPPTGNGDARH